MRKPMTIAEKATYRCIAPTQAADLLCQPDKPAVFDVRDAAAYRQGHIPDAAHLSEDRLPGWFRRLPKDQPVLIYCYKGNASQTYAQMFVDFRFQNVYSVDGGYEPLAAALAGR